MSELVLLCGVPTETPMALVGERLREIGCAHLMLSQRRFEQSPLFYEIDGRTIRGSIRAGNVEYRLEEFTAVYTRLMDDRWLPELLDEPPGSPRRLQAREWHDAIGRWCDIAPVKVVNRPGAMGSNGSKPFQAQVISSEGFLIPETLITSDPERLLDFLHRHGRVIYKSMSGVRSIVREVKPEDLRRLDGIRGCPVQFQAYVAGRNVRVHTVGDDVFATAVTTEAIDYRYAESECGEAAELEAVELSPALAERCLALARRLDLPFAGIDLKITPDDEVYCFEVNPSPAYSYYEAHTGQPISAALAVYLAVSSLRA